MYKEHVCEASELGITNEKGTWRDVSFASYFGGIWISLQHQLITFLYGDAVLKLRNGSKIKIE